MPLSIIAILYLILLLTPLILAFRWFFICFRIGFEPENNSKIKGDYENSKCCKSRSNRPKKQAK